MTARKHVFFDLGFHGDQFLIEVVSEYLQEATHFLETGTNVASTLQYVGAMFPRLNCFSCEPDQGAFAEAKNNTKHLHNIGIWNCDSVSFLQTIQDRLPEQGRGLVCWLDAHGHGFQWPLKQEVEFFTRNFPKAAIFIDDFKVPDRPDFEYDQYDGQECSFDFIQAHMIGREWVTVYPTYTEHTSLHHPLRGWCLLRNRNQSARPSERRWAAICENPSSIAAS